VILDRCACCSVLLAANANRYVSRIWRDTDVFALCEPCAERIAVAEGAELDELRAKVQLRYQTPQGNA
jgi:hypothetical protein